MSEPDLPSRGSVVKERRNDTWPELRVEDWVETKDTLHL
jgi:hypothetical protein